LCDSSEGVHQLLCAPIPLVDIAYIRPRYQSISLKLETPAAVILRLQGGNALPAFAQIPKLDPIRRCPRHDVILQLYEKDKNKFWKEKKIYIYIALF